MSDELISARPEMRGENIVEGLMSLIETCGATFFFLTLACKKKNNKTQAVTNPNPRFDYCPNLWDCVEEFPVEIKNVESRESKDRLATSLESACSHNRLTESRRTIVPS